MQQIAEGVIYYTGIADTWQCTEPGKYICLSPVCGSFEKQKEARLVVKIAPDVKVLQDSGAFSDSLKQRLSVECAMERQEIHAIRQKYANQIEYQVTYDLLIDETWTDHDRKKRRWSVEDAEWAVEETVSAAKYYSKNSIRNLCLSLQGVNSEQYVRCAERVLEYRDTQDIIGLGGWCILGIQKGLYPDFVRTLELLFPLLERSGVQRVHIFGVLWARALGSLLWMADQYGIQVSTDSTGPVIRPIKGTYGYGEWRRMIEKPKGVENKIRLINAHVAEVINWLRDFRSTKWYGPPNLDLMVK